MTKLFVSGFPLNATEMDLAKLIVPYGSISTIKIVRDKQTGRCKGYAFVEMNTEEDALHAVEALNNAEMAGNQLTVNITEDKPQPFPTKTSFTANKSRQTGQRPSSPEKGKRPRRPRI